MCCNANHFLRKTRVESDAAGTKQGLDKAKRGIIHGARSLRRVLKPVLTNARRASRHNKKQELRRSVRAVRRIFSAQFD